MTSHLVTVAKKPLSPQKISDDLNLVIKAMAESDMDNSQSVCIYNILCGVGFLLNRYETIVRETLLEASLEEDEKKLRSHIINLHKNGLYQDIWVPQLDVEKFL